MVKINRQGTSITVYSENDREFISLTEMLRAKDGEFLAIGEQVHNPNFNYGGFAVIRTQATCEEHSRGVAESRRKRQ